MSWSCGAQPIREEAKLGAFPSLIRLGFFIFRHTSNTRSRGKTNMMDINAIILDTASFSLDFQPVAGKAGLKVAGEVRPGQSGLIPRIDDALGQMKAEVDHEGFTEALSLPHECVYNLHDDQVESDLDESFLPGLANDSGAWTNTDSNALDMPWIDEYSSTGSSLFLQRKTSPLFGQTVYSNMASTLFHIIFILTISYTAYAGAVGQHGARPEPIFVSLVDPSSSTVCSTGRASMDSAASTPSIADRSRMDGEKSFSDGNTDCSQSPVSVEDGKVSQAEKQENVSEIQTSKLVEKASERSSKDAKDDVVDFMSKSRQDSVASLASIAQIERRSASTRGDRMDEFKLKLLAAIHDAAYYPRKALRSQKFGEVMVSFTLLDDGKLENLKVDHSSGSNILDEAALQILTNAAEKFPRIPDYSSQKKLTYVVPITFRK